MQMYWSKNPDVTELPSDLSTSATKTLSILFLFPFIFPNVDSHILHKIENVHWAVITKCVEKRTITHSAMTKKGSLIT